MLVKRDCLLAGSVVSCPWKNSYTVDHYLSLNSIANQPPRSRVARPCILAHCHDGNNHYGIPRLFLRLSFTTAFVDVALVYLRNINTNTSSTAAF
jgi:hypothetical protein